VHLLPNVTIVFNIRVEPHRINPVVNVTRPFAKEGTMQDKRNLHLEVQDMIKCYSGQDPLKVMSGLKTENDFEQAAIKWLAAAAMHGITSGARKISLSIMPDGEVKVGAKYKKTPLPSPGKEVGAKVVKDMQEILHIEKGKLPLALGVGDDTVNLRVKLSQKDNGRKLTLKFPE
jgi:hypothetical protein